MRRGFFAVFEGTDGSGKSTQAKILAGRLASEGRECVLTEEPGGTDEGRRIRELLLDPKLNLSPKTELFLFLADRSEHVHRVIRPGLDRGKVVICSRYFFSTLVYQGIARRTADPEFLETMNLFAVDGLLPDVVFFLDVRPELGLTKATTSSEKPYHREGGDRIEQEGVDFQRRVRDGYLSFASRRPELFVVVDGSGGVDEVGDAVHREVMRRLPHD